MNQIFSTGNKSYKGMLPGSDNCWHCKRACHFRGSRVNYHPGRNHVSLRLFAVVVAFMLIIADNVSAFASMGVSRRTNCISRLQLPINLFGSKEDSNEIERLMDQAAKLRAEIAEMEGKPVAQVHQEAQDKKQLEKARLKEQEESRQEALETSPKAVDYGRFLEVPRDADSMIRQAARAIERAFRDGKKKRQTVRLALLKEGQSMTEEEEWPGGARQMYRESAKPLTLDLLREIRAPTKVEGMSSPLPPVVKDQDIWDFDGSGLITAESKSGAHGDVQGLVFANTDVKYINDIETLDKEMGDRLLLLVNPFWRNVDSWGFNILAPGAKARAKEVIFKEQDGFDETYVLLRFSARGEQCVALKAYPYDWQLFAYREDEDYRFTGHETAIRLGSSKDEPTSAMFSDLLNDRPEFKLSRNMRQMKNMM